MGVDASLFAKKSKTYFYFDREYNLQGHWKVDDIHPDDFDLQDGLLSEIKNEGLGNSDTLFFLEENLSLMKEAGEANSSIWTRRLIKFVKEHPDDHFFIRNESQDMYDLYDEYKEWKDY